MEEKTDEVAPKGPPGVGRYSRNRSIMSLTNNPFEAAAASVDLNVEVLTDAVLITEDAFEDIILGPLKTTSDNEERLAMLSGLRQPFLFSSAHLLTLCNLTTSLKTKMAFIQQLAPRLVDPSASTLAFTDMFRFVEEKLQVEQLLKDRAVTLSKAQLTNVRRSSNILAGRGGRGGAGRGNRSSITGSNEEGVSNGAESSPVAAGSPNARSPYTSVQSPITPGTVASSEGPYAPQAIVQPSLSSRTSVKSIFGCVSDADADAAETEELADAVTKSCALEG